MSTGRRQATPTREDPCKETLPQGGCRTQSPSRATLAGGTRVRSTESAWGWAGWGILSSNGSVQQDGRALEVLDSIGLLPQSRRVHLELDGVGTGICQSPSKSKASKTLFQNSLGKGWGVAQW